VNVAFCHCGEAKYQWLAPKNAGTDGSDPNTIAAANAQHPKFPKWAKPSLLLAISHYFLDTIAKT
jgi:hypothetical protein